MILTASKNSCLRSCPFVKLARPALFLSLLILHPIPLLLLKKRQKLVEVRLFLMRS